MFPEKLITDRIEFVGTRISPSTRDTLLGIAKENNCTLSYVVWAALEKYAHNYEFEKRGFYAKESN